MLKSCTTCAYAAHIREINKNHYVTCKNPEDYKGPKKSELGLTCWRKRIK